MIIYDVLIENGRAEIVEVEVVEKPKTFVVKNGRCGAYNYRTRIPKENALLTKKEAIAHRLEKVQANTDRMERQYLAAKTRLAAVVELKKEFDRLARMI